MELGLYYYNARYYVPGIGRFASADTIVPNPANPQSFNRYSYTSNNPVKFTDPSGHVTQCSLNPGDCEAGLRLPDILKEWKDSGLVDNPNRTEPLKMPVVVNDNTAGWIYTMPVNSNQSTVNQDSTRYKAGRFLAGLGIATDAIEMILAVEPGAAFLPSLGDTGLTYFSGVLTGDNYVTGIFGLPTISEPPLGLPRGMWSINQDFMVNAAEAAFPPLVAGTLGVGGLLVEAATAPIPGDGILYESGALFAYQMIDIVTSGASAMYDSGRVTGSIPNYVTVGIAPSYGPIVIYWPQ